MNLSEIAGRDVYASAGETVTCENGHPICSIARTVVNGHPFVPSLFCNWMQPEPKAGSVNVGCRKCGAPFYEGLALHFADGYRYAPGGEQKSPTGPQGQMRAGLGAPMNYERV